MERAIWLAVMVALAGPGCAGRPSRPAALPDASRSAAEPRETDWAALLFPAAPVAAAPAETAEPAPTEAVAEAPRPGPFGPSDVMVSDDSIRIEHRDLASFCKAQIGCFEIALPVRFVPNDTFRSLHALRVTGEGYAYSTLVVELPSGVAPLQVAYDVADPNDPGCPSIVRKIGIERVSIERGMLVVVALGESTTWTDPAPGDSTDSGARGVLRPVVSLAKADGERLHLRHFETMGGPDLGSIVQPSERSVPWHTLTWKHRTPFAVEADGTLRLLSKS